MTVPATIVDWSALWQAVWHAAVSGVLICAISGLAVRSYARWHDLRLEGDAARASLHVTVAVVATAAALAMAAYGVFLITQ